MAIVATRLMFQAGSRVISGNLAGKFLNCTVRPPQGGALPPRGGYEILPPMNDPIYGRVALMVPAGGSGEIIAGLTMQKCLVTAKVYGRFEAGPTTMSNKKFSKPDASPPDATSGQVFVLSDKPVLGRNCVVVSSGFADLMDGLQTAGGARVTVA
jgi:hypothetical protein